MYLVNSTRAHFYVFLFYVMLFIEVLEQYKPPNAQCVALLASDREATLSRMAGYVSSLGCDIK
jgi:hypothetical protein